MTQQNHAPKQFRTLLRELTTPFRIDNRRAHHRAPRSLSLKIQPLDLDFQPDGDLFWALSRDISQCGIGFINPEPLTHEFIRIGLMDYDATIIAQIRHCTSIGVEYPLFLIGVEFVAGH